MQIPRIRIVLPAATFFVQTAAGGQLQIAAGVTLVGEGVVLSGHYNGEQNTARPEVQSEGVSFESMHLQSGVLVTTDAWLAGDVEVHVHRPQDPGRAWSWRTAACSAVRVSACCATAT